MSTQPPQDGSEFEVRVRDRWFPGCWREDAETGAITLCARFASGEWWPVRVDAWRESCFARPDSACAEPAGTRGAPVPANSTAPAGRLAEGVSAGASNNHDPIGYADVVTRVTRMVQTLKALPDPEWRFLTAGSRINWPATVDSAEDIRAQRENHSNLDPRPARFQPTHADLSRLDATVAWFQQLEPLSEPMRVKLIRLGRQPLSPAQWLIWQQACGATYKSTAEQLGVSNVTARNRTLAAWQRLHAIACADLASARVADIYGARAGRAARSGAKGPE